MFHPPHLVHHAPTALASGRGGESSTACMTPRSSRHRSGRPSMSCVTRLFFVMQSPSSRRPLPGSDLSRRTFQRRRCDSTREGKPLGAGGSAASSQKYHGRRAKFAREKGRRLHDIICLAQSRGRQGRRVRPRLPTPLHAPRSSDRNASTRRRCRRARRQRHVRQHERGLLNRANAASVLRGRGFADTTSWLS